MRVGIFYHERLERTVAEGVAEEVKRQGHTPVLFVQAGEIGGVDRLLVLGGDGTILHAAQCASRLNIPILGVNYGTRGFLAEFEKEETAEAIGFLLSPSPERAKRAMLEVEFQWKKTYCLNELSLSRILGENDSYAVGIALTIDGNFAGEFVADGLIVATPTGSTAYSLSAGGNIVTPDCGVFLLSPVCPTSLRSRPIIFSDKSVLKLSIQNAPLLLHGDGVYLGTAERGDVITAKKSSRFATFFTKGKGEFFRHLTKKIN